MISGPGLQDQDMGSRTQVGGADLFIRVVVWGFRLE